MILPAPGEAIAEQICAWVDDLAVDALTPAAADVARRQLLDVVGLCVAARKNRYVTALLEGCDQGGPCTVIGHSTTRSAAEAALINGTAAHGEDYDDTFEGSPVHPGSVVVPAVLAACEYDERGARDALRGIVVGVEFMCRMALVTPAAIHRAGFHPTAVIGALGASLGVGAALRLSAGQLTSALGIAGSLASGIIEYLAEGTWTKRMHAGWAAHCGIQAAKFARSGFLGPRTVLEGRHGFFHAFTNGDVEPDFQPLRTALGSRWLMEGIAFKPYACGTMAQPFVDCALSLRKIGMSVQDIESIDCKVGEGTVHRLWEPLAEKRRPSSPYSAKFSVPFCIAVAFVHGSAGLDEFTDERIVDPRVRDLAGRITYTIDPENEYPANYTGHLRVRLQDGGEQEFHQAHLRGGKREPLTKAQLVAKYRANALFGGWDAKRAEHVATLLSNLFEADSLSALSQLRG